MMDDQWDRDIERFLVVSALRREIADLRARLAACEGERIDCRGALTLAIRDRNEARAAQAQAEQELAAWRKAVRPCAEHNPATWPEEVFLGPEHPCGVCYLRDQTAKLAQAEWERDSLRRDIHVRIKNTHTLLDRLNQAEARLARGA